jgi:hypothetical protein
MLAALVPLVVLQATLIAVKPTDAVCPSPHEVSQAIELRLPGVLVAPQQSGLPDVLLLTVSPEPSTGAPGFTLVDGQQQVRLRRELPPPATGAGPDCPALAETVALMVERYLQDLAYHGEGAPPELRHWDLFVGASWRPGAGDSAAYEVRLGASRLFARGRMSAGLVLGVEGVSQEEWSGVSGRLQRFPAEVRLLARLALGPTFLEAGPFAGVHLLRLESQSANKSATDVRLSPVLGMLLGLRIPLGRAVFARLVGGLGLALLRYDYVTRGDDTRVAFGTERLWGKMGIEAGFSFW